MWPSKESFRELKAQVKEWVERTLKLELAFEGHKAAAKERDIHRDRTLDELQRKVDTIPDLHRRVEKAEQRNKVMEAAIKQLSSRFNGLTQYIMQPDPATDPRGGGDDLFKTPPPFSDPLADAQTASEREQLLLGEDDE